MRTYNNIIEKKNVLRGIIDRQQTSETSADIVLYINNEPRTLTIPIRSNGTFYLCIDDYEGITKIDIANSSYVFEYVKSLELDCPSTLTDIKSILKESWNSYLEKVTIRNLPNGVTDLSHMFDKDQKRLNNLRHISLINWDTSNVTDISYMFSNLTDCEIKGTEKFDTRKVTNMSYVFNTNTNIKNINISSWNTKNVESYTNFMPNESSITVEYNPNAFSTSMLEELNNVNWYFVSYIEGKGKAKNIYLYINETNVPLTFDESYNFYYEVPNDIVIESVQFSSAYNISKLNMHIDTSSITNMENLFSYYSSLTELTLLDGFGRSCTNMSGMFNYCESLTTLDLTNLDTSSCTNMSSMFSGSRIKSLILPQGFGHYCTNMSGMFSDFKGILDLTNLDTSSCTDMSGMFSSCSSLTSLTLPSGFGHYCTNMSSMFSYGKFFNLTNLDTTSCTDMNNMFYYTVYGGNLVLPQGFGHSCTNMSSMFRGISTSTVSYLNLSNLDTSSCIDMSSMFHSSSGLTSLTLPQGFGSACTDMSQMFYYCSKIVSINLINFDTSSCTNMSRMFCECSSITAIDLSNFDTSSCTDMSYMFEDCYLTSLTLPQGFGSACTDMSYMFHYCPRLTSLDLTNLDTSSCTNMSGMFSSCSSLTSLTLPSGFGHYCTNMSSMFASDNPLNLSNLDTSSCTDMSYMFQYSEGSFILPQGFGSACEDMKYMYQYHNGNLNISNLDTSSCIDMDHMFYKATTPSIVFSQGFGSACENMYAMFMQSTINSADLTNFDTSHCKNMSIMFNRCLYLTSITFPVGFGSACENMNLMFVSSNKLSTLNLTNLDTSSCTNIDEIFNGLESLSNLTLPANFGCACKNIGSLGLTSCRNLRSLTIPARFGEVCEKITSAFSSSYLTSLVINGTFPVCTNMSSMFSGLSALTSLTLPSGFGPSCTNAQNMFNNCNKLTSLIIPTGFGSNCTNMSYMFNKCSSLTSLTLPSGFGHNCTNMSYMFNEANVSSIDISDIDTTSCTNMSYMFYKATTNTTITIPQNFGESCTNISYMFNSSSVKLLDIQNFDTKDITTYTGFLTNSNTIMVYYDPDNINTAMKSSLSSVKWMIPNSISGKISNSNETFTFKINSQNITVNVDSNKEWSYKIPNNLTITSLDGAFEACDNLTSIAFADVDLSECISMSSLFKDCINLTQISLQQNFGSACEDMSHMFEGCTSLVGSSYLTNLDTSSCKDLSYFFKDCTNLYYQKSSGITIDFPEGFGSVCEDMSHMFDGCSIETSGSTAKFDLTNLDTSSCTDMSAMFKNSFQYIYSFTIPAGFGSACEDMSHMFEGCKYNNLFKNNLKNLDTSSCVNMEGMFKDFTANSSYYTLTSDVVFGSACTNMSHMFEGFKTSRLNITSIDTSSCTDMSYMFSGWTVGTSLQIAGNFGSVCEDASYMLKDCAGLSKNIISSLPVITSNSLSNIDGMFEGTSFDELDLTNWNIFNITSLTDLFKNCENLTYLDIRNWNTTSINSYTDFIPNESSLTVIYTQRIFNNNIISEFDEVNFMSTTTISGHSTVPSSSFTVTVNSTQYTVNSDANGRWKLVLPDNVIVTSFDNAFDSTPIDSINFAVFDTSTCTSMNSMFNGCTALTEVNLNSIDISACTDISNMFNGCTSLTKLIINKWNTTSINSYTDFIPDVTTLSVVINSSIFDANIVSAFNNVNWINYDNTIKGTATANKSFTANINGESVTIVSDANGNFSYEIQDQITSLYQLFKSNTSIKTVDLSGLDVSNCTNFTYMFQMSISSSLTSVILPDNMVCTSTERMFQACKNLTSVDVSKIDMSTCTNISYMFYGCTKLTTLDIRTWDLSNVTTYGSFVTNKNTLTVYYDSTKVKPEIVSSFSSVNWVDVSNS